MRPRLLAVLLAPLFMLLTPAAADPYLGLQIRNDPAAGAVVSRVAPGPLSSAGIRRSDVLIAVVLPGGERIDTTTAADLAAAITQAGIGAEVTLMLERRADADPNAAVPAPGTGEATRFERKAVIDDSAAWRGTVGRGLGDREIEPTPQGEFEAMIIAYAKSAGVWSPNDAPAPGIDNWTEAMQAGGGARKLIDHLARTQNAQLDPNALPAVVQAFRRPLSTDAVEAEVFSLVRGIVETADEGFYEDLLYALSEIIGETLAAGRTDGANALQQARDEPDTAAHAQALVNRLRLSVSITDADARRHIAIINRSPALFESAMDTAFFYLGFAGGLIDNSQELGFPAQFPPLTDEDRQRAEPFAEGDILGVIWNDETGAPQAILGGPGPNTYRVTPRMSVIDLGGDDTYRFQAPDTHHEQVIIDLEGNDTYTSEAPFAGPASAVLGVSLLIDRAGNDTYETQHAGTIGFGLFGIGLLIDEQGDDRYTAASTAAGFNQGAGVYGAGIILDRAGNDTYTGQKLAQGVGGPRGLGLIIDAEGNDTYTADGPSFPSAYGTPDVYLSMSQGFGYGARGYAAGGLGGLYDLAGDDAYQAGEFAMGCAYYWAMGVLHDAQGNDVYNANRYGHGTAAHQAIGMLIDDAGNDTYTGMTAASMGAPWDESIGILIDRAGDDTYTAHGLALGSAAQQALGFLIDLAGSDTYAGRGNAQQGATGNNTYHFNAHRVFSFAALLDLGPGQDTFAEGRTPGTTIALGAFNAADPQQSTLFGLFIDDPDAHTPNTGQPTDQAPGTD